MNTERLSRLQDALQAAGLDALALNPGPSLVYLTGLHFHLSERPVVMLFPARGLPGIILPELERLKVLDLEDQLKVFPYGEDPSTWEAVFAAAGQSLGLEDKLVGVEPRSMRLLEFLQLQVALDASEWPEADDIIGSLRVRKDANEIVAIRRAIRVAQDALEAVLPLVQVGMTEKELASELVMQLLRHGSEPELPFFPIVSTGPNGANPHAVPSERKLQEGDLLVVDWGASVDGYISDLTRTFTVGEVQEEYRRIFDIVAEANAAGRAAGKPGAPCSAVDQAAREVIEKAGYGEYFTHRTGHGIGLEAHEEPYMRGDNEQVLQPGMVFTVEPGIYLPGRNGVRIEDNIVITTNGNECLSDMPREWRVVG